MSKQITLYSHASGPNPWKVAIVLEELGIPYKSEFMEFPDLKKDPYESLNPNGRVPTIDDPNTGVKLWESGAIIQYLVETYDKENKLSYGDKSPEKFQLNQWLQYQMSGQGPYFGQRAWFQMFHSEKVPSAVERYGNEIKRVTKVIDSHLKKQGTSYLVGDKCTYADLSFVPWFTMVPWLFGDDYKKLEEENPHFAKWNQSLVSRPAVSKVLADKQKASQK